MPMTYYDFRILIGPPWRHKDSDYHYDWSVHDLGASDTFQADLTLASNLSAGGTTAYTNDNSDYPPYGGFWVGPSNANQGWEYMEYSGMNDIAFWFNGLLRPRTEDREAVTFNHGAGATVRMWWEIEADNGAFELNEETDGNLATVTWSGSVGGVLVPRPALRNDHLCVVQTRTDPAGSWANAIVGWTQNVKIRDDHRRFGEWNFKIVSAASMVNRYEVAGVRAGDLDIAKHGSASGSIALNRPYKERSSGDYSAAAPSFDHNNVLDRDTETLWIAEQFVGTANDGDRTTNADPHWLKTGATEEHESQFVISGIYLQRPPGYDSEGYRWIELTAMKVSDGTTFIRDCWVATETNDNYAYADIGGTDVEEGEKIVLCESESVYRDENPLATPKTIVEIGKEGTTYAGFWDDIDVAGDTIALRQVNNPEAWQHGLTWGTGSGTTDCDALDSGDPEFSWSGSANVAAPAKGETIRYLYKGDDGLGTSTDPLDYWSTSGVVTPGYTIGVYDRDEDGWNLGEIHDVYLIVTLPVLPLQLTEDITATVPGVGEELKISDAVSPNTGGLPSSGTLQVGDEQITYSAKSDGSVTVSARGANSTTAAVHDAGDAVFLLVGEIATNAPPVKELCMKRSGGSIVPFDARIYYTLDENPRSPEVEFWENDWTHFTDVSDNVASTWTYTHGSAVRARKLLIIFDEMSSDPARPRLNEFSALVDPTYYTSSTFTTTSDAAEVIETILEAGGVPAGAITNSVTETALVDTVTAPDRAWTVAADLADYAGLQIIVERDSKFTISTNGYQRGSPVASDYDWDRVDAKAIEFEQTAPEAVRQLRMDWAKPDDSDSGSLEYPEEADETEPGAVVDLPAMLYPNETTAQAALERRFWRMRYPYVLVVECAEGAPSRRPLDVNTLTWDTSNTDWQPLERSLLIEGASHRIQNHVWSTILNGRQIERQSGG